MPASSNTSLLEALAGKTTSTELFTASSDSLEVGFSNGEVKNALSREASGVAVRAQHDGKVGFVGSRDTSPEGLERLVTHVENALEVGDPVTFAFPSPSAASVDPEALLGHDEATAALTTPDLVTIGQEAMAQLKERFPDFTFDAKVRRSVGKVSLTNSNGLDVGDTHTVFSFSVEANRTQDEDVLIDYAYRSAPSQAGAPPQAVIDQLARRLEWSQETVDWKPGSMPVLFSPAGSFVFWSPLLQALSGKTVMLGTSPIREKLEQQLFDQRVEIIDDGLLPGGLGSSPFDDEGVPRRRRALIEAGVLRGFVHDLETAQATGQDPTGNAERGGVMAKPSPGFSNLLVRGGEKALAEMMAGIDYGILVHSVMGMGQGNTLPGTFSNPLDLAFLIEGGQVKGRIKNGSIAGNLYELLKDQLAGLSSEVESVGGSSTLPWVLLDDMNVVGQAK